MPTFIQATIYAVEALLFAGFMISMFLCAKFYGVKTVWIVPVLLAIAYFVFALPAE